MREPLLQRERIAIFFEAMKEPYETVALRWGISKNQIRRIVNGRKGHQLAQDQRVCRENNGCVQRVRSRQEAGRIGWWRRHGGTT